MLARLGPCENMPVFLQKSVGDLLVGGDFLHVFVSPCCEVNAAAVFSFISVTWLVAATKLCRLKKPRRRLENAAKWCLEVAVSVSDRS